MSPITAGRSILLCARHRTDTRRPAPLGALPLKNSTILSFPRSVKTSAQTLKSKLAPEVNTPVQSATLECWIDASTKNNLVAAVIGSTYKTFRLKDGWKAPGRDNFWAEMIAFELLIQVLVACQYSGHATIYSDSASCLGLWGGGSTKVKSVKECNERLRAGRDSWLFTARAEWVSRKVNLADAFSRGRPMPGYAELRTPVAIPVALKGLVHRD